MLSCTTVAALAKTGTQIDDFAERTVRGGVLTVLSATLRTTASVPVQGATLEFQISDGSAWRSASVVSDVTTTNTVTDPAGHASAAFLPPDGVAPGRYRIRAFFGGNSNYAASSTETVLNVEQAKCNDEGVVFDCAASWEVIRLATHRTDGPAVPLVLVHGSGADNEKNRENDFTWATLKNSILQTSELAPFDVFIWKHDTARAVGFNGATGNAADLAEYINKHLLPRYPADTKVVFVAHSRGGLVVRSFMNYRDQGDRVLRLITLGTPHHGSPFALPDWAALTWAANLGVYPSAFGTVYSFAFDATRLGHLSLAWDNMDGVLKESVVLNSTSGLAKDGRFALTPADANAPADTPDSTVFYSRSLKAAFGTLAELNQHERYREKIVRYGAFDDSLDDNDKLLKQSLTSLTVAFSLATDSHKALQAATSFLAFFHTPLNTTARYFANDGQVPLQSALFLDTSAGNAFSAIDRRKRVSLSGISTNRNCGAQGPLPLNGNLYRVWWGSRDQIRDHRDLIETANRCYWQALALDIDSSVAPIGRSFKP
ncbi:MAG TPA: hypothetical protein VKY31_03950 [Terriglobia bacterium]|nr:hypothetical protein [Terriglobia bacterium]